MFTGIIEKFGIVTQKQGQQLVIRPEPAWKDLKLGESICVNGVCLTVEKIQGAEIFFRLLPETVKVSTLGQLRTGDKVNLERSLRLGDRLGGHLLLGHVDGQGTLVARTQSADAVTFQVKIQPALRPFLVPKGPVALDGVSLTLGSEIKMHKGPGSLCISQVQLVAHTLKVTTLGKKKEGNRLNLELDPVAKYLRSML